MTSLLTNAVAMSTLRQMAVTQKDLAQVQNQASSGLKVASASDNAAYWSIGVGMKSQVGALSAVQDGLALSSSIAKVTSDAVTNIIAQFNTIKNDLVAAQQPGVSAADIDLALKASQQQIITVANSASFNGQNWLVANETTDEVIQDTATYSQSAAAVQGVLNRTASVGSGFSETIASAGQYTRLDAGGTHQTMTTSTSHVETYTVGSIPNPPGAPIKTLSSTTSATTTATSGQLSFVNSDIHVVQSYNPTTGLNISTISDDPLRLFTNNSGKVTETNRSSYADGTSVDNNLGSYGKSEILLTTSQAASYNANTSSATNGLLDQALTVSNASGGAKTTLLNMTTIGATQADLGTMLNATETALAHLTKAGATLGAVTTRIAGQTAFNAALSDAVTAGVGTLTDADMNTTATRIQALQTQQQLQTQSLNIANQNSQSILKLFG